MVSANDRWAARRNAVVAHAAGAPSTSHPSSAIHARTASIDSSDGAMRATHTTSSVNWLWPTRRYEIASLTTRRSGRLANGTWHLLQMEPGTFLFIKLWLCDYNFEL